MYPNPPRPRPTGINLTVETNVAELLSELEYLRFFYAAIGDGMLGASAVTVVNNEYYIHTGENPPEGY